MVCCGRATMWQEINVVGRSALQNEKAPTELIAPPGAFGFFFEYPGGPPFPLQRCTSGQRRGRYLPTANIGPSGTSTTRLDSGWSPAVMAAMIPHRFPEWLGDGSFITRRRRAIDMPSPARSIARADGSGARFAATLLAAMNCPSSPGSGVPPVNSE